MAIIGDGAMTGGLAFEGLNNTSMDKNNLLIVLNDNHMAIDPLKGGFTQYLVDLTTSETYNKWRWRLYQVAERLHVNCSDQFIVKVREIARECKKLLIRERPDVAFGCIQQE